MLFFFDESGDFALPPGSSHKIAVCTGFVLPESSVEHFNRAFGLWAQTLQPNERRHGEPKGFRLSETTRKLFFDVLDQVPDILVESVFIDLQAQRERGLAELPHAMREEGLRRTPLFEDTELGSLVELLAQRFGNLSEPQVLRLFTLSSCIELTLRHALLFRAGGPLASCWKQIQVRIDRTSTSPGSREELVLRAGLPVFLMNRSKKEPFLTIKEHVGPDHPIERLYCSEAGLETKRMLKDVEFVDSKVEIGVQAADVLANSFFLALNDLDNVRGELKWYRRVMRHSIQGPGSAYVGPIVLGRSSGTREPVPKYSILVRIMKSK